MDFILAAINEHKSSPMYKMAVDAEMYYDGENPTINRAEKVIHDIQGQAHKDMWTANHKIASSFFGFAVDQMISYLMGNGVTFKNPDTKDKLGNQRYPFDQQAYDICRSAPIGGVSFGFWNYDHIDKFTIDQYVPLVDEENGAMMAGIFFWQLDADKPLRVTLFELDGYTEYVRRKGEDMQIRNPKRGYIMHARADKRGRDSGDIIYKFENYKSFPIVPIKNNDKMKSEICGKRNTIDAYDLLTSNMVNDADKNTLYWVIKNAGGMDDWDDWKFFKRAITTHVVHGENNEEPEPHTIEAPFEGTQNAIDTLDRRLYQDFQVFDASAVSAGNQTATAIKASYVPLDLKTDKFEIQVTKFINGILALAGIDDEPSYTRNKLINSQEEAQTVLMGAEYMTRDYIVRKLLTILGDPDMAEEILDQLDADNLERFSGTVEQDDDIPTADEAIDAAEEAVGKTLNGSQTSSLITVIKGLKSGDITEGQAVRILTTSIGVSREEALAIIRGE